MTKSVKKSLKMPFSTAKFRYAVPEWNLYVEISHLQIIMRSHVKFQFFIRIIPEDIWKLNKSENLFLTLLIIDIYLRAWSYFIYLRLSFLEVKKKNIP